jgi:hypothetical protein
MFLDQLWYILRNYDWDLIILGGFAFTIWNYRYYEIKLFSLMIKVFPTLWPKVQSDNWIVFKALAQD